MCAIGSNRAAAINREIHGVGFGHAYFLNMRAYFPFQGNDFDKCLGYFQSLGKAHSIRRRVYSKIQITSTMQPATSRRLQSYLTGLATTTGLVASSGAAIVNIDITDIGGPNANLADGGFSVNYGMVPGLPDLAFYAFNAMMGLYGFAAWNMSTVVGSPAGFVAAENAYTQPKNFGYGQSIGTGMNFATGENFGATLFKAAGKDSFYSSPAFGPGSYLGFTDGQDHYGWLEVTWDPTLGTHGTFEVISGAYESEAGVSIGAGLTAIPEPGNLLALSGLVGSAMFLRTRRRKSVA